MYHKLETLWSGELNMNTTADQEIYLLRTSAVVTGILFFGASTALNVAVGGIYSAAGKAGTQLLAASQVYSSLTSSAKILSVAAPTTVVSASPIYFSLTTPQGSVATVHCVIFGFRI